MIGALPEVLSVYNCSDMDAFDCARTAYDLSEKLKEVQSKLGFVPGSIKDDLPF